MTDQRFDTPRPVRVEIAISAGEVEIETADGSQSTVTVEASRKLAESMRVELVGDRLLVQQRRKGLFGVLDRLDGSLAVRARVPHGSAVQFVTASGHARLDGRFADLEMKSSSGDLVATGEVAGDARISGVSGSVRLPGVGGDLIVRTVSGDIAAEAVRGSVSARSASGDVRVESVREGEVTIHSVSGDVELGIAPGTNVDVDAASASGALHSDVPLSDRHSGDAGPTVVIRANTVSGDFRILRAGEVTAGV